MGANKSGQVIVTTAKVEHAEGMANTHIQSWIETYSGIVSEDFLARLDRVKRTEFWRKVISTNNGKYSNLVALHNNSVVGFASAGPGRHLKYPGYGEVYAIYLLKDYQGCGVGYNLFNRSLEFLRSQHYSKVIVEVLVENTAVSFYHKTGGKIVEEMEVELGNAHYHAYMMEWQF